MRVPFLVIPTIQSPLGRPLGSLSECLDWLRGGQRAVGRFRMTLCAARNALPLPTSGSRGLRLPQSQTLVGMPSFICAVTHDSRHGGRKKLPSRFRQQPRSWSIPPSPHAPLLSPRPCTAAAAKQSGKPSLLVKRSGRLLAGRGPLGWVESLQLFAIGAGPVLLARLDR